MNAKRITKAARIAAFLAIITILFTNVQQVYAHVDYLADVSENVLNSVWLNENDADDIFTSVNEEQVVDATSVALESFIESVMNGEKDAVVGVYVEDVLDLAIIQQPSGAPAYVSSEAQSATQFGMAGQYGSIGLIAHNYLSGEQFFDLEEGQEVSIVFGDGSVEQYVIHEIRHFQALSPNSAYSDFLDLDDDNARYDVSAVFYDIYDNDDTVVFQTCIANDGVSTWGRLFVSAERVS